jgi:poly(A) polymerase
MSSTPPGDPETAGPDPAPRVRPRSQHPISRKQIDPDALKVLYRLSGAGFKGYLFPGGKIVEVATFRRRPEPLDPNAPELLMTEDNTFGTARQDALRRDFTINGLFYDIADFAILDYVGGLDDLEAGLIRTIGDPDVRFREDPVRMLRAVEFASRLGFAMTPDGYEAILAHRKEIAKSAPPRVTEELAQMLRGGHALPTFLLLREVGLLDALLPELATVLREIDPEHPHGTGHLFWALLDALDAERRRGRPFDDAVLFALLVLPVVRAEVRRRAPGAEPAPAMLATLIEDIATPIAIRMAWPHAVSHRIKQALSIVGRLSHRPDNRVPTRRLIFRDSFPTALALFELSAMATGRGDDLVREWRALSERMQKARESFEAETGLPAPSAAAEGAAPPRRRRRRRGGRGRTSP